MNAYEVIQAAKEHFGETAAPLYDDDVWESWFKQALIDIYRDLAPEYWRQRISNTSVALTAGGGDIPDTVDVILDVRLANGAALTNIGAQAIHQIDGNEYQVPPVDAPAFAVQGKRLLVRPEEAASSVDVMHQTPVDDSTFTFASNETDLATDVGVGLPERFHSLLAYKVTSYAYAQEEDLEQAAWYGGLYQTGIPAGATA